MTFAQARVDLKKYIDWSLEHVARWLVRAMRQNKKGSAATIIAQTQRQIYKKRERMIRINKIGPSINKYVDLY